MLLQTISFLTIFTCWGIHPFHVSVCEIAHNPKTNSLDISMKVFINDFEIALRKQGHEGFAIDNKTDDDILAKYLQQRFTISVNGQRLQWDFIGFETNEDEVKCFLQAKNIKVISSIDIENKVLLEALDDQVNLTHFEYRGSTKSIQTTAIKPSGKIDTSSW